MPIIDSAEVDERIVKAVDATGVYVRELYGEILGNIGDINTALDEIIALQNSIIGGE